MRAIFGAVIAVCAGPTSASGQTAAEILEQLNTQANEEQQYRDLLSHPDPNTSRGAMKIMASSGNPDLMRMALDAGLSSADPTSQRIALEGYFSSNPSLQITVDGSKLEDMRKLVQDMSGLGGTVDSAGKAFFTTKLGDYDAGQSCWVWHGTAECGIRLTDAGSSIRIYKKWAPMSLGEDRNLTGEHSFYYLGQPLAFVLPVAP